MGCRPSKKIIIFFLTIIQQKYLTYKVKYDKQTYSATNNSLNLALAAGATKPLVVRVDYVQPTNSSDLPQEDVEVKVTGKITYSIDQ